MRRGNRSMKKVAKGLIICVAILLLGALLWQAPWARELAVGALGKLGSPAAPWVRPFMHDPDPDVRQAAVTVLKQLGTGAVPALTRALDDADAGSRAEAAEALGFLGPAARDAVGPLTRVL